ncbi:MAG: hypothetical protein ABW185_24760, partial [Sedimenticola sp.]
MNKVISFIITALLVMSGVGALKADDTEIYRSQFNQGGGATSRPKVLIIFDNSYSMYLKFVEEQTGPEYDPNETYSSQGSIDSSRVYWSTSGSPPSKNGNEYVPAAKNRCASSSDALTTGPGVYQDQLLRWSSYYSRWVNLNDSSYTRETLHMDCRTDVTDSNASNPGTPSQSDGYPSDNGPYGNTANTSWDDSVTLYSANYMNWYHGERDTSSTRRIDIAKNVVTNIIDANPGVDFGLMLFNSRYEDNTSDGGRVAAHLIEDMTETQRTNLTTLIDGIDAHGWTPLCETTYEAYRYLSGLSVQYGDDDNAALPARDSTAETTGTYNSPLGDCQFTHVILMTDGLPTHDTSANSAIETLTGRTCSNYPADAGQGTPKNCLPDLAYYLHNTDLDNDSSNGTQKVVMYTIGFDIDQDLLEDAAREGGGRYYTAFSTDELSAAFQSALTEILSTSTSFSSPTVAVDTFNRTQSRNEVFMAMFE